MTYLTQLPSPLGTLTLASDGEALPGLWLEGQKYFRNGGPPDPVRREALPVFRQAEDWLRRYFAGARPGPEALPLRPQGSPFQQTVWGLLKGIPYGTVTTYKALGERTAAALGRERTPARAVGGAVARNPISLVIPCHRVVGADGSLTGYAGGLDRKVWLLALEGVALSGAAVLRRSAT